MDEEERQKLLRRRNKLRYDQYFEFEIQREIEEINDILGVPNTIGNKNVFFRNPLYKGEPKDDN